MKTFIVEESKMAGKIDITNIETKSKKNSFSYFAPNIRVANKKPCNPQFTLEDAYATIKNGLSKETAVLRKLIVDTGYDSTAVKDYKATHFPYAVFGGVFSEKNKKGLLCESGLISLDLDHVKNPESLREKLIADQELDPLLIFVTPRGEGLKVVLYVIDGMSFTDSFETLSYFVEDKYGIQADEACKDLTRASFLCHDERVWISPKISKI